LNKLGEGEIGIQDPARRNRQYRQQRCHAGFASKAIMIGFNVQADVSARRLAEKEGVDIRLYEIIYRMTEDIEKALKGMLEPELVEKFFGRAQVLQVFTASKFGRVAGCRVTDGELQPQRKGTPLYRGTDIVYEGDLSSLAS
jgi:translation initiation factor IF-2